MILEPIHFGTIQPNEVYRKTVIGALYYPQTKEFVYLHWPNYYDLTTMVSGGVEEGEDEMEALKREILEETGFVDFQI